MKIICSVADGECPRGLPVCCGTCPHHNECDGTCDLVGTMAEYMNCPNAELED